jgi:hypothetical protein
MEHTAPRAILRYEVRLPDGKFTLVDGGQELDRLITQLLTGPRPRPKVEDISIKLLDIVESSLYYRL